MEFLILPFGILPLILLVVYLIWKVLQAIGQRAITDNHRFGRTEFPSDISTLLCGTNEYELAFTEDGKSVILTMPDAAGDFSSSVSVQDYIRNTLSKRDDVSQEWIDQLTVVNVASHGKVGSCRITITMPSTIVVSIRYIENEIKNIGRVFMRNTSNRQRFLLFPQKTQHIEVINGRVFVRIDRVQLVPNFLGGWTEGVMSERQITRNIKNRLWNQVDVKCTRLDRKTYCGEIILPVTL
jgi:hypothetical protein